MYFGLTDGLRTRIYAIHIRVLCQLRYSQPEIHSITGVQPQIRTETLLRSHRSSSANWDRRTILLVDYVRIELTREYNLILPQ